LYKLTESTGELIVTKTLGYLGIANEFLPIKVTTGLSLLTVPLTSVIKGDYLL